MTEVFVEGFGVLVGKKSERLIVKRKGEVLLERPFFDVERVIVATESATISAAAIHECVKKGIPLEFLSYSGAPYASLISPNLGGTVKTRREQLLAYEDRRGVFLGRAFASAKLKNAANNLKYHAKYRKAADRAAYDFLYERIDAIEKLAKQAGEVEGNRVDEVRGALLNAEGRGAALYWEGVKKMVPDFLGSEGRGATDLVNSLLNYGYGILYNRVLSAVTRAGLDSFAGYVRPRPLRRLRRVVREMRGMYSKMRKRKGGTVARLTLDSPQELITELEKRAGKSGKSIPDVIREELELRYLHRLLRRKREDIYVRPEVRRAIQPQEDMRRRLEGSGYSGLAVVREMWVGE